MGLGNQLLTTAMGLFSSKKTTYVSTVTYPLGEDDPAERTDYNKYIMLNALLQKRPLGESITRAYLHGQGMKMRHAYRYARDKYYYGLPHSGFFYSESPDREVLHTILKDLHPDRSISFINVLVAFADYTWWAERFLTETFGYDRTVKQFNHPPTDIEPTASVSYDISPGGLITILLMNSDGYSKSVSFTPPDMSTVRAMYAHAVYRTIQEFPTETTTSSRPTEPGDEERTTAHIATVNRANELQETTTTTIITVAGGVTTTTVKKAVRVMSRPQYFLYELGKGTYPELDEWVVRSISVSPFFPSVPLRLDNRTLEQTFGAAAWPKHPLKKTGTKLLDKVGIGYQDVEDRLNDNEQLNEIDFAFVMFGVAINTKSPEGMKYLYRFFDHLHAQQAFTKGAFDDWSSGQPPPIIDDPPGPEPLPVNPT